MQKTCNIAKKFQQVRIARTKNDLDEALDQYKAKLFDFVAWSLQIKIFDFKRVEMYFQVHNGQISVKKMMEDFQILISSIGAAM